MNMVEATVERRNGDLPRSCGRHELTLGDALVAMRPALECVCRPHQSCSASARRASRTPLSRRRSLDRQLEGVVVLREPLGSEIVAHFDVDARPALTEDIRELARDVGQESRCPCGRRTRPAKTTLVGRFGPRSRVHNGDVVNVAVTRARCTSSTAETGDAIYAQEPAPVAKTQTQEPEGAEA